MNMKKIFIAVTALLAFSGKGRAQNYPHYTQYIINNYILNPALSGIENYTDIKVSHRHQWLGFTGNPRSSYITIHGPLGKHDYRTDNITSYRVPGENPRGKNYWEEYTAAAPHHGIGLTVQDMKAGFFNFFKAKGTYAYHLGIAPKVSLSAGVAAGVSMVSIDKEAIKFNNAADPTLGNSASELNRLKPELDLGVWLYSDRYYIGVSAMQLIPQKFKFTDNSGNYGDKLKPHIFASAGYRMFLNEDVSILPSILAKYVPNTPTSQFDVNVKAQYQDLVWLGASYRFKYGYAALAGVNVSNTFNVGYSYDYTTTRLNHFSKGTHEVVLGFLIGNKYGDWCPRNVW
jgi:type IX secretion system PorP/SprF family membrane protein